MNGIENVVRYGRGQNLKETDEYALNLRLLEVVDVVEHGDVVSETRLTWQWRLSNPFHLWWKGLRKAVCRQVETKLEEGWEGGSMSDEGV